MMYLVTRRVRRLCFVAVCALAIASALVTIVAAKKRATIYRFRLSGLHGAGFQNVLTIKRGGRGLVVVGDVSGFHRSTDYGDLWQTSNNGLTNNLQGQTAAITFSHDPATPDTVYAATGERGMGGGFFASVDGGRTWERRSDVPQFSGNNNPNLPPLPRPHPRSTGNLIAEDVSSSAKFLYVATFRDGVMRSTDGGRTWARIGLAGKYLRSLLLDACDPSVLYAAAYDDRIWKTTRARNAASNADWRQLDKAPQRAEEMIEVGDAIYVAGTDTTSGLNSGVFKSSDGGATWARRGGAQLAPEAVWMAIDGYQENGRTFLYAGCDKPRQISDTSWFESVMRSDDGGAHWTNAAPPAAINFTEAGTANRVWWLSKSTPMYMLGKGGYTASQIVVDPEDHRRVYAVGRSGIWRTADAGHSWQPVVNGLAVTVNHVVAVDPTDAAKAYIGNTDYKFFYSTNHLIDVATNRPPNSPSSALDIYVDPQDSRVYLTIANHDANIEGKLYSNPNPAAPDGDKLWTNEKLEEATGGNRPVAVIAGRDKANNCVIIAAIEEGTKRNGGIIGRGGLYRKVGVGAWARVEAPALKVPPQASADNKQAQDDGFGATDGWQISLAASLAWTPNSSDVYLYDYMTSLWRSIDYGATWTRIWDKPSRRIRTGYVVADPAQQGRVYVSNVDGVFRLTNAHKGASVGTGIEVVKLQGPAAPGTLALGANGRLYATSAATAGHPAALYEWPAPSSNAKASDIADDYYRGIALFPSRIAVGKDGTIYISLSHNSVIVGTPQ